MTVSAKEMKNVVWVGGTFECRGVGGVGEAIVLGHDHPHVPDAASCRGDYIPIVLPYTSHHGTRPSPPT